MDVDIVWAGGRISNDLLTRYQGRAEALAKFYRDRVLPRVPLRLFGEKAIPALTVRFEANLITDGGLFIPPDVEFGEKEAAVKRKTVARKPAKETKKARSSAKRVRKPLPAINRALAARMGVTRRFTIKLHENLILSGDAERTLAHEFFHAIHWLVHPDEPAWLREGMAQVFETWVFPQRKFNASTLKAGFDKPSTSLTAEMDVKSIALEQYGHGLLYFYYLVQRCGGEALFWTIVESTEGLFGERSIEWALKREQVDRVGCRNFPESFVEFQIARAVNARRRGVEDPKRWFLVHSTLGTARAVAAIPTEKEWMALAPWTPVLVTWQAKRDPLPSYLRENAWWIRNSFSPEVKKAADPGEKGAARVLLLKIPSAK